MDVGAAGVPQLWGGIECSIVRLQDSWRNQVEETGHLGRLSDLDAIEALGIRTLRYPVLWESVSPDPPGVTDFSWHDARLARLRDLRIEVVAGLLHHGSGPRYTNLLDPDFPELLAQHAENVARRYPWLRLFTPVNEPLTTARFSALYGHWYPHRRNLNDFARAFINQCRAVCLSMRAIREIIPDAQLVQTEDLSKVFSTPLLDYQARYENERRWLTFDLLLGRLDRRHPWFARFNDYGIAESELMAFVEEPCPPDIIGVNHYLTSERFLDHRRDRWPAAMTSSGNGRHRYVDLEAVRVEMPPGATGPEARLRELCERYDVPVAVTEVHHGCSRDEQLRWFAEVWRSATVLAAEGKPLRAVTAWALFGSYDWNSLLMRRDACYEPGAFDVRSPVPRLTAMGRVVRAIAAGGQPNHPVLDTPGWWRRDARLYRPPVVRTASDPTSERPILIDFSCGALGETLAQVCAHRGINHAQLDLGVIDHSDRPSIRQALGLHRPWAVVSAISPSHTEVLDSDKSSFLSAACAERELPLLTFSNDSVFDGRQPRSFVEGDQPAAHGPGVMNARLESLVLAGNARALVVRTSALYGAWDRPGAILGLIRELSSGRPIRLPADVWCSPTYAPDLAHAALDLLTDGETGIWHLANDGQTTWHEFGQRIAAAASLDRNLVLEGARSDCNSAALASIRGKVMPSLTSGLQRFLREFETHLNRAAVDTAA
jgi:dTDP-4-dehydrorhamnose reductase